MNTSGRHTRKSKLLIEPRSLLLEEILLPLVLRGLGIGFLFVYTHRRGRVERWSHALGQILGIKDDDCLKEHSIIRETNRATNGSHDTMCRKDVISSFFPRRSFKDGAYIQSQRYRVQRKSEGGLQRPHECSNNIGKPLE